MKSKRIVMVIVLAIVLLFSTNAFAWKLKGATIEWIKQDTSGIHIRFDSNKGWFGTKTVNAPGIEKNILAIALCAQSSGMNVDLEIDGATITMITIVSP